MEWKGNNRRQGIRIAYPCLIKFFSEEQDQEVVLTHTENISTGGCSVILKIEPQPKSPVTVEIDLMDAKENVLFEGHVAWVSDSRSAIKAKAHEVGIEFDFDLVSAKNRMRLEDTVNHLTKKGFIPLKPVS